MHIYDIYRLHILPPPSAIVMDSPGGELKVCVLCPTIILAFSIYLVPQLLIYWLNSLDEIPDCLLVSTAEDLRDGIVIAAVTRHIRVRSFFSCLALFVYFIVFTGSVHLFLWCNVIGRATY